MRYFIGPLALMIMTGTFAQAEEIQPYYPQQQISSNQIIPTYTPPPVYTPPATNQYAPAQAEHPQAQPSSGDYGSSVMSDLRQLNF